MIVIDTSALVAILLKEPEDADIAAAIAASGPVLISAATRVELMVTRFRDGGLAAVEAAEVLLREIEAVTAVFDETQVRFARDGYTRFNRGRYGLNLGDCFSYALAKSRVLPLLYKGQDFRATDVRSVL